MIQSRLTPVGKLFTALLILFYGAAVTSQSGLLLFFIGLIGGCLLANWFYARNVLQGLRVEAPDQVFVSEGSPSSLPWSIINHGKRVAEQVDLFSGAGRLFRLQVLSAGCSASLLPEPAYTRRGVYSNRGLQLATSAPFGLVRAVRRIDLPGELVVYPKVYDPPMPAVSGLDVMAGGKLTGKRRVSAGANFAGVRAWQPGDPFKQIHWKSSARGPDLMVKTFEEELAGRLAVVISCDAADPMRVDDCVRAAGSLLFAAIEAGHQAALWNPLQNAFQTFAPFSHGGELLHALARFEPEPVRDWETVVSKLPHKSAVALVTAGVRPGEQTFLHRVANARRQCSLYLPAGVSSQVEWDHLLYFKASQIWAAESGVRA